MIPSATSPKLLLPARPGRVAAGAVRNYNTAAGTRQRVLMKSLALAMRAGLGGALPHRIRVRYDADAVPLDIEEFLSAELGRPVRVSLLVSPPRAVRKPVLQILDDAGATVGYAKLGVDAFTDALVTSETAVVTELSELSLPGLRVPDVLYRGRWQGHALLVQSAFARGAVPHAGQRELVRAMDELAAVRGIEIATLRESLYWRGLRRRITALDPGDLRARLVRSAELVEELHGDDAVRFGASHGDWAPWNMTIAGHRALVWDWEKFETGVPVGHDAVHFSVQETVVVGQQTPVEAFRRVMTRAAALLAVHGLDARAAQLMVWLYAIDITVRYLEDDEPMVGRTRMSRLTEWLGPVLQAAESGDHRR